MSRTDTKRNLISVRTLFKFLLIFITALTLGLGSAWYMIEEGSALTTSHVGPWSVWHSAGRPDADPYTKAYMARAGRLPITSTSALYFFADSDESGAQLNSDCEYVVDGHPLNAAWWSLAAYDGSGRLIPNKANRHSFNRTDVATRADGSFRIVLARRARPGNWLPTADQGSMQLVLRAYGLRDADSVLNKGASTRGLPTIRKVVCK
jgi:hypothetical protein